MERNKGRAEDSAWGWQDLLAEVYQVNQVLHQHRQGTRRERLKCRSVLRGGGGGGGVERITTVNARFKKRRPGKMEVKAQVKCGWETDTFCKEKEES